MGLKDKVARALALRWLRGKINDLRGKKKESQMGKVLQFLDGWKLPIGVVVLIAAKIYDGLHNGHTGDFVGLILSMLGWNPSASLGIDYGQAAAAIMILFGIGHKVVKAKQQVDAGSSISGALSEEGYVQKYIADGIKMVQQTKRMIPSESDPK